MRPCLDEPGFDAVVIHTVGDRWAATPGAVLDVLDVEVEAL